MNSTSLKHQNYWPNSLNNKDYIYFQINQLTYSTLTQVALLGKTWLEIIQMSQHYSDNQLYKGNRTLPGVSSL